MATKRVNGRNKGATAERKLVKLFATWWDAAFFRTPGSGAFATRGFMDEDLSNMAGDLVTSDKTFPFCVESKKVEGWTLEQLLTSEKTHMNKWWEQTVRESPDGKIPLLVFTKNRAPIYVMIRRIDVGALQRQLLYPRFETVVNGDDVLIFTLDCLLTTDKVLWATT